MKTMLNPSCFTTVLLLAALAFSGGASADMGNWFKSSQLVLPVISLRQLQTDDNTVIPTDDRGPFAYLKVSAKVVNVEAFSDSVEDLPVYVPDRWTSTEQVQALPESDFYKLLNANAGRPLLYIHGYNEGFDKSVRRALWLRHQLNLDDRLVLLSWPSDGNFINYTRDEADLYWSVPRIRQAIETMAAQFGVGGFDLMAHSLGGRGLSLALAQLYDLRPDLRPAAVQTILVAPDMDAQVFTDLQQKIVGNSIRLTLFSSAKDEPLAISETLHGYPRLGQTGVHSSAYTGFDVVDVSGVPRRRATGHNYHLGSPVIQQELRAILAGESTGSRRLRRRGQEQRWQLLP